MPMETLDIGHGPERSRLARCWGALSPRARRVLTLLLAVVVVSGAGVAVAHLEVHRGAAESGAPLRRTAAPSDSDPYVLHPRYATEPAFALVNRTDRRVFVSTPPRFVFTVPPHRRLLFARAPVCTYQRFTARFRHGPPIGTIRNFCSSSRWVVLRSGASRLRAG